jgi:hypothetical protein
MCSSVPATVAGTDADADVIATPSASRWLITAGARGPPRIAAQSVIRLAVPARCPMATMRG